MNLKLEDKVVVLTGGTGGIGQQICADFLEEGAIVICLIRKAEKFEKLKNWLSTKTISTAKIYANTCNLLDANNIKAVVNEVIETHKRIDILVNCAGSVVEMPFALLDESHIDQMLNTNLKGMMLLTQEILRPMFRQKEGAIVNVSSITAIKGGRGIVPYAAAKAGMDAFTRTLAIEVGRKNIRVNAVRPGAIETEMSKPLEARMDKYIPDAMILGRFGKPKEVSKAVLFLSSNETASYITGTFINIDGGFIV